MKRRLTRFASAPWLHSLLFAAFPVVFLWGRNLDEGVTTSQGLTVLAVVVTFAATVYTILRFMILRDGARAAVATTVIVLLVTTMGRVESILGLTGGSVLELLLLMELGMLVVASVILAARFRRVPDAFTRTLNLVAASLVLLNVVPLLFARPQSAQASSYTYPAFTDGLDPSANGPKRDVYYLIFDRYAGAATLRDLYGFDNTPFLDWLEARGFVVTGEALANYPQTMHSLASSLNMNYLDRIAETQGPDSSTWSPLRNLLGSSAVSRTFQGMGYKYEHIGSWWSGTSFDPTADDNYTYGGYTEFSGVFMSTTALPAMFRQFGLGPSVDVDKQQWERVHHQIEALGLIASDPAPTFTFAHFTLPHPPYVFRADGSFVSSDPNRPVSEAYLDQLRYTNSVIQRLVRTLQGSSSVTPIIVIQSDEGPQPPWVDQRDEILRWPWSEATDVELGRKLRILNAYYLPGDPELEPYRSITPVNTFRLILSAYFDADIQFLRDRTYVFTDFNHPYRYEDVTDRLQAE
jgi:Sulfatase